MTIVHINPYRWDYGVVSLDSISGSIASGSNQPAHRHHSMMQYTKLCCVMNNDDVINENKHVSACRYRSYKIIGCHISQEIHIYCTVSSIYIL